MDKILMETITINEGVKAETIALSMDFIFLCFISFNLKIN